MILFLWLKALFACFLYALSLAMVVIGVVMAAVMVYCLIQYFAVE